MTAVDRYQAVWDAVTTDPVLRALGVEEVYRQGLATDPTEDVYAVVSWGFSSPSFREAARDPQTVTVWFYQRDGYRTVTRCLDRLRTVMDGLAGVAPVGEVDRNGDSGDLYDDAWVRCTRNGTYTVH